MVSLKVYFCCVVFLLLQIVCAKIETDDEVDSVERASEDSMERVGAAVSQVSRRPYSASVLSNGTYACSAVILNTYWLLTASKCFDPNIVNSYVTHSNLTNYSIRVGSSYNNKGGSVYTIKMLINNFDLKLSAVKLPSSMIFGPSIMSISLPQPDAEPQLGHLASIVAWTPSGHLRTVNGPVIEPSLCDSYTKLPPGFYICVGGVQDPNRHFCRRDHGGAVVQNDTLIAISLFSHTCALYTKPHAFPKVASFARWLDSVIWDENNRPSTEEPRTTTTIAPTTTEEVTEDTEMTTEEASKSNMLKLPFEPVNVPLEPGEDNNVLPRLSLYEAYLQNLARLKTSTTENPHRAEQRQRQWLQKINKALLMMKPGSYGPPNMKYNENAAPFDYNS